MKNPALKYRQKKARQLKRCLAFNVVPGAGIEPARLAARDFESRASTNSTTRATLRTTSNYGTGRLLELTALHRQPQSPKLTVICPGS